MHVQTVSLRYTSDNPRAWCETPAAGIHRLPRRDLGSWLGARCWSLYCCLLLTRDRAGLVRYRLSTLALKVSTQWGRPKPVSERTVKRYLRRLEDVGLVENTGQRTGRGCRIRRVFGRQPGNMEMLSVPERTARLFHDGHDPRAFRAPVKCPKIEHALPECVPTVSRCVARCEVRAPGEFGKMKGAQMSNQDRREARVGVEGDVDRAFLPSEEKATPASGAAGLTFSGGAKHTRTDLKMPASFPLHPTEVVGHYSHPSLPTISPSDTRGDRLRKMVNGYRAAMEHHTGKPCLNYTRGMPGRAMGQLLVAARLLEKHRLSPYLWCAAMMQWQRDDAREKKTTWKPPSLRQIYAPGLIDKLRGMIRALKDEWKGPYWAPPRVAQLCQRRDACRQEIRQAGRKPTTNQEDLEAIVSAYFPPGFFDAECEMARREMQEKFTRDAMQLRQGRWIW